MPEFVPHAEDILQVRLANIAIDAGESIEPGFETRLSSSSWMTREANIAMGPLLRGLGRYLLPLVGVVAAYDIVKQVQDIAKNRSEATPSNPEGGQHGVPDAFKGVQRIPGQFGHGDETDEKWRGKYDDRPLPIVNDPDLLAGDPTLSPSYMSEFGPRYQDALLQRGLGGFGTQPGSYGGTVPSALRLEESLRSDEPIVTRRTSETGRRLRRVEAAAPAPFSQDSGITVVGDEGIPQGLAGMAALTGTQEQYNAQGYPMAGPDSPFHGPAPGLGRGIQQGGFESLPGRSLQMTNLLDQQAWVEGGGVEANAAVRDLWYMYNIINEQVTRGIITPEAGMNNLAMRKQQIEQEFGPEVSEQIYAMMDRATAGGFRGGLWPQSNRGEISIGDFDESSIPEWQPAPAGQYGLSQWTLQTEGRIGEGLAPYLGPGRSKLRRM